VSRSAPPIPMINYEIVSVEHSELVFVEEASDGHVQTTVETNLDEAGGSGPHQSTDKDEYEAEEDSEFQASDPSSSGDRITITREIIESETESVVTGDLTASGQLSTEAEFVNLDQPIDAPSSNPSDSSHPVSPDSSHIGRLMFFIPMAHSADLFKSPRRPKSQKKRSICAIMRAPRKQIQPTPKLRIAYVKLWKVVILITGSHFSQQKILMATLDISNPSKTTFSHAQFEPCDVLFKAATESCRKWADTIQDGVVLGFDGSWSQRRAAKHCFGAFVEGRIKKGHDFKIVETENFTGTSQGMERETL